MRIVTIVGARPQFIKAAPVSHALRARHEEILVHTGQHYDHGMSGAFFDELGIPAPSYSLAVGSATHGAQTGRMLERIEEVLLAERPGAVLVYGDTNSTLAGALAAVKLHIPVIHVEAGLRSHNSSMPEEINRVITDRVSTLLLCPSSVAVANLAAEGITHGVHVVGDVMYDALLSARDRSDADTVLHSLGVESGEYAFATIHRAGNTDDPRRLREIIEALARLSVPVVLPVHPRTRAVMTRERLTLPENVIECEPLSYLSLVAVVTNAKYVVTDSGGLQKEAYWLGVPCITVREQTEWVETIESGWNRLVAADASAIVAAAKRVSRPRSARDAYGSAGAAQRVVQVIEEALVQRVAAAA